MSRDLLALDEGSRLLLDNASDGIAIIQDGMMKLVNPSLLKLTSYSEHELTSGPFIEFVHPDDRQMVAERHFMRMKGEEVPSAYSFRIVDKQGDIRWVEMNAHSIIWQEAPAVLCFLMDVTERRRAEEAGKQSEEKYRNLFENTQDGVEVIDAETGRIVLANQAAASMFGFDSPDEMVGIDPLQYTPAEDREQVAGMMLEYMFEKDLHKLIELRARTKDGRPIWVSGIGVKTQYQGRLAGLVSMRDITEQKETEEALRQSERHHRLLAENISDVIWVTDMNLKPTYFSPSVTRLTGYSVEEVMAGTLETSLTLESAQAAAGAFSRVLTLAEREPGRALAGGSMELEFRCKDGSTVWVDTTVSFLRDSAGRPVEVVGVMRDISQRRRVEERLRESLIRMEKTMEGTIRVMASIVETKDSYTAGHQRRVSQLAYAIAQEMGLSSDRSQAVRTAGLLHDLGKISVPADILTKPGRLTDIEFALIKIHPQAAYEILKNIESFGEIAKIVLQHHERMNGSGYPFGLSGEQIIPEARILAVSDVVEAMSSNRPYRPALGLDKALQEIANEKGILYDGDVVEACLSIFLNRGFKFQSDQSPIL